MECFIWTISTLKNRLLIQNDIKDLEASLLSATNTNRSLGKILSDWYKYPDANEPVGKKKKTRTWVTRWITEV